MIIFGVVALIFIVLIGLICIYNRKFIRVCAKTAGRDIRGIIAFSKLEFMLRYAKFRNLTVHKWFEETERKYSEKVCFYFEDEEWTFRMVQEMSNRVGNYFSQQNFVKGDTVAIFMENRPEYICIWLGLAKIGVAAALINTNLRSKALEHCLKAANCKSIIYGHELIGAIKELINSDLSVDYNLYSFNRDPNSETKDDIRGAVDLNSCLNETSSHEIKGGTSVGFNDNLFYIYTSGTTGLPKAAIIKHSRYIMITVGARSIQKMKKDDVVYTAFPLYHSAANVMSVGYALINGNTVAFRKKFSASNFWKDCVRYNVTAIQYIGEVCRYLLAQPVTPEETRHKVRIMFGSGLREEIWTEFLTRFKIAKIREYYGATEGNCNMASVDNQVGSVGFIPRWLFPFSPIFLMKIDEETGEPVRDTKTGLVVRAKFGEPGEMAGIINERHTFNDFQGYTDKGSRQQKLIQDVRKKGDSAFRSGDVLIMDECGYFYFKDRQGDTFRWKGENVSTAEVESLISKALDLRDCAVYGVEIPGTEGKAGMASIVDPSGTVDLKTLYKKISNQLPSYACPLFIRILGNMDLTGTHKIKKVELRKEGFDIKKVPNVYFLSNRSYVPLDDHLYAAIMAGDVKI